MYKNNPFDIKKHPNVYSGFVYAMDVITGKIPACRYVIGSCKRYVDDLTTPSDIFYFDADYAERYLRLVQKFEHVIGNWPTKNIEYDPWQKWIWSNIMGFFDKDSGFRRFRIAHVEVPRGSGKALSLDTEIPTPDRGIIKFGELKVGDSLYSSDGTICKITGKNDIHYPKAYLMTLSDGTKIKCSENHLWITSIKSERERKNYHKCVGTKRLNKNGEIVSNTKYMGVRSTKDISDTLKIRNESNHAIHNSKAVVGTNNNSQLPYVLGYWLGDGNKNQGKFTAHEDQFNEIVRRFKSNKLEIEESYRVGKAVHFIVKGLTFWLKEIGVLNNKHIPEKYFISDEKTRRDLLRGLMDSDGSISKEGRFEFTNTNSVLIRGVRRLIASLGYKSTISTKKTKCQNGYIGSTYVIRFSTPNTRPSIFGIRKKEDRRSKSPTKYCDKRYVIGVEEIPKEPMFCIEVDSKDKSFLITDQYVVTHNSAMASQCSLFFLALDNPVGNMIANVATKREQARIVLDSSRAMAMKAKAFLKETGAKVLAHTITHKKSNSIIRALSSDTSGLDGLNDILAVCDELHAMPREVFEVIYSGMSKRKDSLTLCITTAGFNTDSIGFSQSVYARKVCERKVVDEQFFAVVYTIDEGDDIFAEETWKKANPGYGTSVDIKTFKAKAIKAQNEPQDIPNFKVKHLNMWLSEMNAFFDMEKWDLCADPTLKIENFKGKKCRLGIDVASHLDLSSIGTIFRDNGIYYLFDTTFIPEDTVNRVRSPLYDESIGKGYLHKTPGEAIDQDNIEREIVKMSKEFRVFDTNLDPWNTVALMQRLQKLRIPTTEFRMSVSNLSEPMKQLDSLIRKGKIRHNGSPLLRWCISNVVAKIDAAGNVYPRKNNEKLKIDPVVALLMAMASWIQDEEKESIYEERKLRSF